MHQICMNMFRNVFSNYLTLIKVHSYNYKLLKIMLLCFQLCEVNASYDNFLSIWHHAYVLWLVTRVYYSPCDRKWHSWPRWSSCLTLPRLLIPWSVWEFLKYCLDKFRVEKIIYARYSPLLYRKLSFFSSIFTRFSRENTEIRL